MNFRETVYEVVDRIHLGHDKNQSRAFANTVMNLRFHERRRISWL